MNHQRRAFPSSALRVTALTLCLIVVVVLVAPSAHATAVERRRKGRSENPAARLSTLQKWICSDYVQEGAVPLHQSLTRVRQQNVERARSKRTATLMDSTGDVTLEEQLNATDAAHVYRRGTARASGTYVAVCRDSIGLGEAGKLSSFYSHRRGASVLSLNGIAATAQAFADIHIVDSETVLVFLPTASSMTRGEGSRGDASGIAAAAAAAEVLEQVLGANAKVLNVFATSTGQLLKLSRETRSLLFAEATTPSRASEEITLSSPFSQETRVGVWTAPGQEHFVLQDLLRSRRLRDLTQQLHGGDGDDDNHNKESNRRDNVCEVTYAVEEGGPEMGSGGVAADCTSQACFLAVSLRERHLFVNGETHYTPLSSACAAVLRAMVAHPAVRWVERLHQRSAELLNDKASALVQGGHAGLTASSSGNTPQKIAYPLWDLGLDGKNEIIAIADSGLDVSSCFFADAKYPVSIYPEVNMRHRKVISFYACEGPEIVPAQFDVESGHGTHVAGSVSGAACGYGGTSPVSSSCATMRKYNGIAPGAKLFFRALGCDGTMSLTLPTNIRDVFAPAYSAGARIASNSWGFRSNDEYTAVERVVDKFVYSHDDMLILFAAGNVPEKGLYSPGMSKNVLTVGSHLSSALPRDQDSVSPRSAYGPTYDGRRKPDVVGPGGPQIWSVRASGLHTSVPLSQPAKDTCEITSKAGTSMATALVAGGAALVRQHLREDVGITVPSAALMKSYLIHASTNLASPRSGFGRVDLSLLVPAASPTASALQLRSWIRDRVLLENRATHQYCFSAYTPRDIQARTTPQTKTEETFLKVTLGWTDIAAAAEGSRHSLVHDLDLVVVDVDGKMYYVGLAEPTAPFFDRMNNFEQVRIPMTDALAKGFRAMVYGHDVRAADVQAYALVVSAPGLEAKDHCDNAFAELASAQHNVSVQCPNQCSGHGTCDPVTKQCLCHRNYASIDCSLCDSEVLCNRHGVCNAATMTCTCTKGTHFIHADCSGCVQGWYGPGCDSRCECANGGTCNEITGLCVCPQDKTIGGTGCFQGSSCQYCCEDFGGDACNERSYWCDESGATVAVDDPAGALIQVNGYSQYPFCVTCRWRIKAPSTNYIVVLDYLWYDIETPYDMLYLYDLRLGNQSNSKPQSGSVERADNLLRKDNGRADVPFTVRSMGPEVQLVFVSDWAGVRRGFVIKYRFKAKSACKITCQSPSVLPLQRNEPGIKGSTNQDENTKEDGGGEGNTMTCGEAIRLPDLCICQSPFFGWNCDLLLDTSAVAPTQSSMPPHPTTAADGNSGAAAGRPREAFLSTESLLFVDVNASSTTTEGNGGGGSGSTPVDMDVGQAAVYLPLVVNGFSVLRIQVRVRTREHDLSKHSTAANDEGAQHSSGEGEKMREASQVEQEEELGASLVFSLIPVPDNQWLERVVKLIMIISEIDLLGDTLSSTTLMPPGATPQRIPLFYCPDTPMITVTVPLQRPSTAEGSSSLSLLEPQQQQHDGTTSGAETAGVNSPSSSSSLMWVAQVLVALSWNASESVPAEAYQAAANPRLAANFVVVARSLQHYDKDNVKAGKSLRTVAQCTKLDTVVLTGEALLPEPVPVVKLTSHSYISTFGFLFIVAASVSMGIAGGFLWQRLPPRYRCDDVPASSLTQGLFPGSPGDGRGGGQLPLYVAIEEPTSGEEELTDMLPSLLRSDSFVPAVDANGLAFPLASRPERRSVRVRKGPQ